MEFLENEHKFFVDAQDPLRLGIDFGPNLFVTSLVAVSSTQIAAQEAALTAGGAAFNSGLIPSAIGFHAECVVASPKEGAPRFPDLVLKDQFEFGFVQGIKHSDIILEYWGQTKVNGRSILHIAMPNTMQVDTDTPFMPWSKIAATRFAITNITQTALPHNFLKVTAKFLDHPLYLFNHTINVPKADTAVNVDVQHFIRFVRFKRELRTIFCFQEKKTGDFTAISATGYTIEYNHEVNYTNGGTTRTATSKVTGHRFPTGGSPSGVDAGDKRILAMAKAGAPLLTPAGLGGLLTGTSNRTVTKDKSNPDFDPAFFK